MEPLSAAAAILSLADIALRTTSALIEYAQNTSHASSERRVLLDEATSLNGILRRLQSHAQHPEIHDNRWDEHAEIVQQFSATFHELARTLDIDPENGKPRQRSRLRTIAFVARWSFTKAEVYALIERISRLEQYASSLLLESQHELVEAIGKTQQDVLTLEKRTAILRWISNLEDERVHDSVFAKVAAGSGSWFLESESYKRWKYGDVQSMWGSGIPGAGKTAMASIVIDDLQRLRLNALKSSSTGLAFTYLKYNNPNQNLTNVFGSLLKQLMQSLNRMPQALEQLYDDHQQGRRVPDPAQLSDVMADVTSSYERIYFVIDALDECDEQLRWDLISLMNGYRPKCRILTTSRRLETIAEDLPDYMHVLIRAHPQDMELYIDTFISKHRNLRQIVEKRKQMREAIKDAVVRNAEDMQVPKVFTLLKTRTTANRTYRFLLAKLHLDSIISAAALSVSHVRRKLQTLPKSLEDTYNEALDRIELHTPDQKDVAFKALAWITYAFRPLTVHELQHALAIEPGATELDEDMLIEGHNITSLCAGLVTVDVGSSAVNLVHHTARPHFDSIRETRFPGFHATITMSCTTYLSMRQLKNAGLGTLMARYPLSIYSAQFLGEHARQSPEETLEPMVLQEICELLTHPEKRQPLLSLLDSLALSKNWNVPGASPVASSAHQGARSPSSQHNGSEADDDTSPEQSLSPSSDSLPEQLSWELQLKSGHMGKVTALHLAASMGLAKVASLLLAEVPNVDAVDEGGKTALSVAMERGFEKAVELLVNSGAAVDLNSDQGQAVFLTIVESDWHSVADTIISKAETLMSSGNTGSSTCRAQLLIAAYKAHIGTLAKLTSNNLIVEDASAASEVALFVAIERHQIIFVERLLDAGVSLKCRDSSGKTALHRAARRQNVGLMQCLLERGSDVDARDDEGRTPWSANLRNSSKTVLDHLLKAGADPNTRGLQGVSELYTASENGELDVIKLMVSSGTNPSIRTQFRWAPLHWAAYFGHLACVRALICAGAELSPVSDQDATPLDLALRARRDEVTQLLLRHGAKESKEIVDVGEDLSIVDPQAEEWSTPLTGPREGAKLSLTFDKPIQQGLDVGQYLYPSTVVGPTDYIYQLSDLLSSTQDTLSLRRADRRADMIEYPLLPSTFSTLDSLYTIVRDPKDRQSLTLRSGSQALDMSKIEMHKDWTGGWKVYSVNNGTPHYLSALRQIGPEQKMIYVAGLPKSASCWRGPIPKDFCRS